MESSRKTALLWSLSFIIFMFRITSSEVSDTNLSATNTEVPSLDVITNIHDELSEKIMESNAGTCGSIGPCENGGTCENEDGGNSFCQCKNGTSGERCEVIDECKKDSLKCGIGTDVKCIYNVSMETAECVCNDEGKDFDSYKKKCRVPCNTSEDCPEYSPCRKNRDNSLRFCKCPFGTGGDRCNKAVDECKERGLDCGSNPEVECLEDKNHEGVCYCQSWSDGFNYEVKDCVKCNCEGRNLGCHFKPSGEKECYCEKKYYQVDGKCEDCECGTSFDGCKSENGVKVCQCWDRYVQVNGTCQLCDCGRNSIECSFQNGQKRCSCKSGYLELDGTCKSITCGSIGQCENGGTCVDEDGGNSFCQCKNGTSGERCEVIDECTEQDSKCGSGTDVKCIYNVSMETAECVCNNEAKGFDSYRRQCRVPCNTSEDCYGSSNCKKDRDNSLMFCKCPFGIRGDRCNETRCQDRGLDCGSNPDVICTDDLNNEPVCYCRNWSVGFNYEVKDCVICNCEGQNLGCRFEPSGEKVCYCDKKYYQVDGKCKDCECGKSFYSCKLENGTKVCQCWEGYVEDNGICQYCNCGPNSVKCFFQNGEKRCSCKSGYLEFNGTCKKICLNTKSCENGGICKGGVCQCLPGTSGDRCADIDDCKYSWDVHAKCDYIGGIECAYNQTSQTSYCRCKKKDYVVDDYTKDCKYCDCGPHGTCSYKNGDRTCDCEEGYKNKPGPFYPRSRCEICDCGPHSTDCRYPTRDTKECSCETGYEQKGGECEVCSCGRNGMCSFNDDGEKVCKCDFGYKESKGFCIWCYCGLDGECQVNDYEEVSCNCQEGYGVKDGICTRCSCSLYGENFNCTFTNGKQKCLCPKGYEEKVEGLCSDIDECEDLSICPSHTICRNTIGSYECDCEKGYRPRPEYQGEKIFGCVDIDECEEENGCPYRDTSECMNTQGSYSCYCKPGYYNKFSAINIEYEGCQQDQTGWRIGYIILIVIFLVVIIGMCIAIFKRRTSR